MDTKALQDLQKQVNDIFLMASTLTVRGDAVDIVAAIRASLRELNESIAKLGNKPTDEPSARPKAAKGGTQKEVTDG